MGEKEIYGYIYMVKNLVNGKIYFGKTVNDFDTRYNGNITKYTHNDHLRNSINTYGIENFEINEEFDIAYTEDDLWDLEDLYICIYNTLDSRYGYNKKRSGSKHKGSGRPNEETRNKISETLKGTPKPEEHKIKISETLKGKPLTEKTKQKMSKAHRNKKLSEEHKQKLSENHADFKGNKNPRARIVICLETQQLFATIKEAEEWLGKGSIIMHLKGKAKSAGKHPITNEKLHWMYYEDYLKRQEEQNENKEQNLVTTVA